MQLSIQLTPSILNKIAFFLIVLLVSSGCTRRVAGNSTTGSNDPGNGSDCLEIVGRSLKATKSYDNNYRFREEIRYAARSSECTDKELSVRKTICVEKNCKTTKRHKMKNKSNAIKVSFVVDERKMDKKFTIFTEFLLKDLKIRTYGYEFYPRNCLKEACVD